MSDEKPWNRMPTSVDDAVKTLSYDANCERKPPLVLVKLVEKELFIDTSRRMNPNQLNAINWLIREHGFSWEQHLVNHS